jgi:hypothetical protein
MSMPVTGPPRTMGAMPVEQGFSGMGMPRSPPKNKSELRYNDIYMDYRLTTEQTPSWYHASSSSKAHVRPAEHARSHTMLRPPPDLHLASTFQGEDASSDGNAHCYISLRMAQSSIHARSILQLLILMLSRRRQQGSCHRHSLAYSQCKPRAWSKDRLLNWPPTSTITSTLQEMGMIIRRST